MKNIMKKEKECNNQIQRKGNKGDSCNKNTYRYTCMYMHKL